VVKNLLTTSARSSGL